jgi:uncharacterized protein YbjT (DUF2867 family)
MNILILGAVGGTGSQLVRQAVDAGHRVTALARDPTRLKLVAPGLVPFQGDVGDAETLRRALAGQDVVISALGNPTPFRRNPALVAAVTGLVRLMEESGSRRLIYLSTILVPESRPQAGRFVAAVIPFLIGREIADHVEKERAITASGLDWTIVRSSKLGNGRSTQSYLAGPGVMAKRQAAMLPRADLAHFMLSLSGDQQSVRAKPVIVM